MSEWEPEIMEAGNRFLAEQDIPSCSECYDLYRNREESSLASWGRSWDKSCRFVAGKFVSFLAVFPKQVRLGLR
jgi:hypothetical protein